MKKRSDSPRIGPDGVSGPVWFLLIIVFVFVALAIYPPTRNAAVCWATGAEANCERWRGEPPTNGNPNGSAGGDVPSTDTTNLNEPPEDDNELCDHKTLSAEEYDECIKNQ